jgi:regulator of ribonuclease activity A
MFTTADLWDEHETVLSLLNIILSFCKKSFRKDHNDKVILKTTSLVRKQLELTEKESTVIDGGASLRCALIGDQLAFGNTK